VTPPANRNLRFVPYQESDNAEALVLDEQMLMGASLVLKYHRPAFHARSSVYEEVLIMCAKDGDRLVGIAASARKQLNYKSCLIDSIYGYDLRVHPDYRKYGTAHQLAEHMSDVLGVAEYYYSFVFADNRRGVEFSRRGLRATLAVPVSLLVLPVMRRRCGRDQCVSRDLISVHKEYLARHPEVQMVPELVPSLMHGALESYSTDDGSAGCSVWSNETLMAEEVVRLPRTWKIVRPLLAPLAGMYYIPSIPRAGEQLRSWFLFDLFCRNSNDMRALLEYVNDRALANGRTLLYTFVQDGDPVAGMIRNAGFRFVTIPYFCLAKGTVTPGNGERIYIDIRDM
jgi:hypothetical protein